MSRRSVKIAEISKRVQVRKKHEEEEEEEDDKEEEEEDEEEEWVERKKKIDVAGAKKGANAQRPRCQADDCDADMGAAKRYFRRHRLCEEHFKAAIVVVRGLNQRFCQQCSRFHEISQFDDVKRSCRRRLAGHNERRRKAQNNSHHQPDAVNDGSSNGETPYPKYPTWRPPSQSVHMHIAGVRENAFKHFHIRQHLKRNRWLKGAKTSKFEKYRLRGGGLLEWFSCRRCFWSACVPIPDSSKEGSTLLVFPIRS